MIAQRNIYQTVMKRFFLCTFILFCLVQAGLADTSPSETPRTSRSTYTEEQLNNVLKEVKAEPKVIDAVWNNLSPGEILYVGVKDDGTRRDGYAEYICQILFSHDFKGSEVHIVDYFKFMQGNRVKLGWAMCPK